MSIKSAVRVQCPPPLALMYRHDEAEDWICAKKASKLTAPEPCLSSALKCEQVWIGNA